MLKKCGIVFGFGLMWLFLFSVPINREQRLFNLAFNYVIDTSPVNWVVSKVHYYFTSVTNGKQDEGIFNTADEYSTTSHTMLGNRN